MSLIPEFQEHFKCRVYLTKKVHAKFSKCLKNDGGSWSGIAWDVFHMHRAYVLQNLGMSKAGAPNVVFGMSINGRDVNFEINYGFGDEREIIAIMSLPGSTHHELADMGL